VSGDLTYFWIPSPDPEVGRAFYTGLFGWTLEPREQGDGYGITGTTVYGGIVGGREGTRPYLYFATDDDVADAADEVHELGGHAGEVSVFPEGASVDCVYDGVEFGIFRPAGDGFAPVPCDRPGDLAYFTIPVRDAGDARSFYAAVLGWEYEHDDIDAPYHHVLNVVPPGGLYTEDDGTRPRSYFRVEDIEASLQLVRALGGDAGMPLESVTGFSANCLDDQGIEVSLWQPAPGF
jgi:predicted enzyme related to lactoylglutathione lyase